MALRLNLWNHPRSPQFDRIYVAGLGVEGKAYFYQTGGDVRLSAGQANPADADGLLDTAIAALGLDRSRADLWNDLRRCCAAPRAARAMTRDSFKPRAAPPTPDAAEHLDVATIKVPAPITIKVDHREPDVVIDELRRAANTTIEVCQLDLGDYVINDRIFIERKSVPDFEASIIDSKRLFDQSERIKLELDAIGVVLIEGNWNSAARMLPQQVIGALSFLGAIQALSVWQTTGPVCTAYTIVKLATHFCNGLGYELGLRQHKPSSLLDAQSYVLEGCPGVNAELARRLLQHFGSIAGVAQADFAALRAVPGIGPKKAQRIVEVLRGPAPA